MLLRSTNNWDENSPAAIFLCRAPWRLRATNNREENTPAAIFWDSHIGGSLNIPPIRLIKIINVSLCDGFHKSIRLLQ